jgi:hypothetical protein
LTISDKDLKTIIDLVKTDIEVRDLKAIILDGVEKTEVHHWRTEEQISTSTKELVMKLIQVAGLQQNI